MKTHQVTKRIIDRAHRQGSVITWAQAEMEGATPALMGRLVATGVLRRAFRGVYVLTGTPDDHSIRLRCALRAIDDGAVASHRSAAWLQGLIETPPAIPEITAVGNRATKLPGIGVHSSSVPVPSHRHKGIPCTTPARTLVDLATQVPAAVLDGAIDGALAQGLVRLDDLSAEVTGRRGQGRLRAAVKRRGLVGGPSPSVLESRMSRLFKRHGLPIPEAEIVAGPDSRYRIDYAFEDIKFAVEAYGYAWHHTPEQLSHDLERQARLTAEGWTFLAYTWAQVTHEPERVAGEIAATYARLNRIPQHA